jgi:hypothetical protein
MGSFKRKALHFAGNLSWKKPESWPNHEIPFLSECTAEYRGTTAISTYRKYVKVHNHFHPVPIARKCASTQVAIIEGGIHFKLFQSTIGFSVNCDLC